ncbi:MAG: hypothetical protein ACE5KX_03385, partial [Acidimicrobiia bacterium]
GGGGVAAWGGGGRPGARRAVPHVAQRIEQVERLGIPLTVGPEGNGKDRIDVALARVGLLEAG